MPKSSKKTKNSLSKTVKGYTYKLDPTTYQQINTLMINYGRCRSRFFNQYCGINNMLNVTSFRTLRDQLRKAELGKQFCKQYDFINKHWTYALFDACSNVNSMWSNLANQIRHTINTNDQLDKEERHLINFILIFKDLWFGVLKYQQDYVTLPKKYQSRFNLIKAQLSKKQLKHAYSYLRRLTRRYKVKPHKNGNHNKSMTYDENMYNIKNLSLHISSNKSRYPFKLMLTGEWHYSHQGNLTIVLDRDKKRIEIHKLIQTHLKPHKHIAKKHLGIDKGLATLLSCSTEREYGIDFSQLTNPEAERLAKYNTNRNQYFAKLRDINQALKSFDNKTSRKALIKQKQLKSQSHRLQANLGSKRYHHIHKAHREFFNSLTNHAIYQMLDQEQPVKIIKEDLTWTKEKLPKTGSKALKKSRRNLASWTKGYLNRRLEYICDKYQTKYQDVNPAYTSQYCPNCGHHFKVRTGKHHELTYCAKCGWMNANTAAAKNIKNRENDPEIKLTTPYKQVKAILDKRI